MTLSGKGDPRERREHAKNYRHEVDAKRPWLFPVLIGAAVLVVAAVVVYALLTGVGA
ncbi:hypothetical protein [Protaetiibacter larvae]|uniref:hypothetical protein n=1 Tax=Protaetiibacter larvae TaxID=2592654 RepID=UPI00143CD1E6|nr:hypothetical protein [Protaetiibacter larvae]